MEQEFETQVLDIDKDKIIAKLRKLGAKEEPEVLQKRWVFDLMDPKIGKNEMIRIRQAGDLPPKITYKKKEGTGITGTKEIEFGVDDFEKAAAVFNKIKFIGKYYQENKRHKFELHNIEFCIDTWPKVPTFLEIEAATEKEVHRGLELLGLSGQDAGHLGALAVFDHYGLNLLSYKELKFES